ncbi:MAG TPA: AEC family transporter [Thermoanaerobacterales bacterium]|nr:AEC family transporter [Thermoanaerobacterales bacterium]
MAILQSAESILSIILIISLGYFLTSRGWFDETSSKLLVNLVVKISLPLLMIHDLMNNFDREKLLNSTSGLVVPFVSIALCYLLSFVVSRIARIQSKRRGVFRSMFFNSNTIFMGLPINLALFGEKSLPYVLLYYIANTFFFWTLGIYEINRDGNSCQQKVFSIEMLKQLLSPPLTGFLAAFLMIMLGIKLPLFLMDTFKHLGNLTTPLSMLFIGITIHSIGIKNIKINKDMLVLFAGRFIISPLSILLLSNVFSIPPLMRNVFVIQAAMPVMTNTAIVSKAYGADSEYVTVMITATTIATIFVVPLYMAVLNIVK